METPSTIPKPGVEAPDFSLASGPDQTLSLSELRGHPVVLVFYPADWSSVCGDQLALHNEVLDEFEPFRAKIVGISVDGVWCHQAFARDRKLRFPLLADFEPKGEVARLYGAYDADHGVALRATFLIDAEGVVNWSHISPIIVNSGVAGVLAALESLDADAGKERAA
ncbi:MAG: redoxin domain-containing protein [Thermomicrobiales bacterium]